MYNINLKKEKHCLYNNILVKNHVIRIIFFLFRYLRMKEILCKIVAVMFI